MEFKKNHLWGGRFNQPTDEFVKIFGASVTFDKVLALYDIEGSIAHATMLCEVNVLKSTELKKILEGLDKIKDEIVNDQFNWSVELEDVHMNIESRLTEICGDSGKKLHTGRSRNDQVATDIRLYLRDQVRLITKEIERLLNSLLDLADQEKETIMPGFTHLQAAQPISFGHHLLAYFEMLKRDRERLQESFKRINTMPLGSAALAGTSYPINRERTAELLGFERISLNSIDAVSDRDFAIEFASNASLIMMHLSRFSEELILWSSAQFEFISLPDSFCTGSSIMPQKKNPDVPELVRGKTGRVTGNLISLLTIMKGQPLAYNKDNQEDKEPLFDSVETIYSCLRVFADMIPTIKTNKENMYQSTLKGYTTATDLADYLVKKGLAFRDAHDIVGKAVSYGIKEGKDLSELSIDELKNFNSLIEEDIFDVISLEGSINSRNHLGGTSPTQISIAIKAGRKSIK
ncbi:argininosuccinate lyase [Candidatus Pseudothioglobus sp. Uisw_050_01]|uniref:argininosuccinate lyase n=1 Tax=Candidatus Pseudothioglobus sp. Uisw_050_01 TaxID=3230997 RepID=UPI003A8AC66D